MGKRMKRLTEDELDSSSSSSSDDETSPRRRYEARRKTRKKEGKDIRKILEELTEEMRKQSKKLNANLQDTREMRKQLEKLTESHNDLCTKLEIPTKGTRSQSDQLQPPKYRLVFTPGGIGNTVEKGKNIEINVTLVDVNSGFTVENGPLASATVELVVVNAEFNQHDNQHNWSREDFERHIVTKQNPPTATTTTNVCRQSVKSIVSNGRFNLVRGANCHRASTIFSNSSNKKVRLGVMVVSPTEERVLEGLSDPFFVRGHDRPNRQKRKGQLPIMQNSSSPDSSLAGGFSVNTSGGDNGTVPPQPHTRQEDPASIQQHQGPDRQMSDPDSFWVRLLNSDLVGESGMQFNNGGSEYLMIIVPKAGNQTCGKRNAVIEPLELDGSVEEVPLKRNLLINDNTNITPTSPTSFCEVLASSTQEERTQGDISETLLTKNHSLTGQPLSSWFHRMDEELIHQCRTKKSPRLEDTARCLASSRVAHFIPSKPTVTGSISPKPKGPVRFLAPPPTARDRHPLASKPILPSLQPFALLARASYPTITSCKGIALTEHNMASKPTSPRVMFGLESHRGWVHPRENIPLGGRMNVPAQISWMELSLAVRLCHVSRTHFTVHHPLLLSSIPSPASTDSHPNLLGRASTTPGPNRATSGSSCVLRRLMYPPPWCFSSVFINGSRSVCDDFFYSSSALASFIVQAAAHHRILAPDLSSSLPPMAMTNMRGQHGRGRSPASGLSTRARDAMKHDKRKGSWYQALDWQFFLGFSFA